MTSRPFTPADLPALLEFVSVNAARSPSRVYLMTSDVAWRWPGAAPERNVRLWWDAAGLAGYAWFEPTVSMEFDVRHDLDDERSIVHEMLEWAESTASRVQTGVSALRRSDIDGGMGQRNR